MQRAMMGLVISQNLTSLMIVTLGLGYILQGGSALIFGGNPQTLIRQINDLKPAPENILLVGHEPYLSRFIALLSSGSPAATIEMKKGGLCKLEVEELEYGHCATLKWLLTPRQMELMV